MTLYLVTNERGKISKSQTKISGARNAVSKYKDRLGCEARVSLETRAWMNELCEREIEREKDRERDRESETPCFKSIRTWVISAKGRPRSHVFGRHVTAQSDVITQAKSQNVVTFCCRVNFTVTLHLIYITCLSKLVSKEVQRGWWQSEFVSPFSVNSPAFSLLRVETFK